MVPGAGRLATRSDRNAPRNRNRPRAFRLRAGGISGLKSCGSLFRPWRGHDCFARPTVGAEVESAGAAEHTRRAPRIRGKRSHARRNLSLPEPMARASDASFDRSLPQTARRLSRATGHPSSTPSPPDSSPLPSSTSRPPHKSTIPLHTQRPVVTQTFDPPPTHPTPLVRSSLHACRGGLERARTRAVEQARATRVATERGAVAAGSTQTHHARTLHESSGSLSHHQRELARHNPAEHARGAVHSTRSTGMGGNSRDVLELSRRPPGAPGRGPPSEGIAERAGSQAWRPEEPIDAVFERIRRTDTAGFVGIEESDSSIREACVEPAVEPILSRPGGLGERPRHQTFRSTSGRVPENRWSEHLCVSFSEADQVGGICSQALWRAHISNKVIAANRNPASWKGRSRLARMVGSS